jgi:hypothetical protein
MRFVGKQPKIWRVVRSLAVAARLGALDREFFIKMGGPKVHEHSVEKLLAIGLWRTASLQSRLGWGSYGATGNFFVTMMGR